MTSCSDRLLLTSAAHSADAPNVVADNDSLPSFEVVSGSWTRSTDVTGDYGQSQYSHPAGSGTAKVRFRPDVPMGGVYEVSTWFRAAANQTANATYTIRHAEGQSTAKVDQRSGGGRWVRLGEFVFAAGGAGTIELSNAANGYVVADIDRHAHQGIRRRKPCRDPCGMR